MIEKKEFRRSLEKTRYVIIPILFIEISLIIINNSKQETIPEFCSC